MSMSACCWCSRSVKSKQLGWTRCASAGGICFTPSSRCSGQGTEDTHKWAFDGAVLLPNDLPPQAQTSNKSLPRGQRRWWWCSSGAEPVASRLFWESRDCRVRLEGLAGVVVGGAHRHWPRGLLKEDAEPGGLTLHYAVVCSHCHVHLPVKPAVPFPVCVLRTGVGTACWNCTGESHHCSENTFKYPHSDRKTFCLLMEIPFSSIC